MRLLETRFLRGPNIHHTAPCLLAVLDLEGHQNVFLEDLQGAAALLAALGAPGPGGECPAVVDAAVAAHLVARLMAAAQAGDRHPPPFFAVVGTATAAATAKAKAEAEGHFRLVCEYRHEAVAEEALRLSVDRVAALLQQQPFDPGGGWGALRSRAQARVAPPSGQTPLLSGCLNDTRDTRDTRDINDNSNNSNNSDTSPQRSTPIIAVTGTNGKTTTTQLINHVLRACGLRTGMTTTQGIYIDGLCVQTGDCSGYWSARKVLGDPRVEIATLETARGGILKRGLAFAHCDVGVVLNVSSDHLGIDGVETLQEMAHVKGLIARCARGAAVLNADDARCVDMRGTLAAGCQPVFFTLDAHNPVLLQHLQTGGAAAWLDDRGWLVWGALGQQCPVVHAAALPFTWQGRARYNIANALAALAALRCMGCEPAAIAAALTRFVSDAKTNPLRGNEFDVNGIRLIVDYAHNVVAYRALCETARSMLAGTARLLGVVTSPGDRRAEDLFQTGEVCGTGFDELVVYEQDPRGRVAGATCRQILLGARSAAPRKPLHVEPLIRLALCLGLKAAAPGDVLVFTCAGSFEDLIEGVRLQCPAAAERIALQVSA